MHTWTM